MGFLRPKMPAQILPPIPPVPPPPPVRAKTDDLKEEVQEKLKRRKGTQATILTSGTGLTTEPEVTAPSLLGSVEPPS
mgnify:CR=1 FL=1|tara:strand:+ start:2162 stop:2392 length:231 start_codon:yes stop_codon:yes gene_type:complete